MFSWILFSVTTILWKHIKKSFLRQKLLPGSVPQQNLPGKNTTPKQSKVPVKRQIAVKSTPRRTQKTSLSITLPIALPLHNYEEVMIRDIETYTNNLLFELSEHYYSLYHTEYSKNITILKFKIQEYSTQMQELKKEICSRILNIQELKSEKF